MISSASASPVTAIASRAYSALDAGGDDSSSIRRTVGKGADRAAIKKTADDLEQVFLSQMLGHMFSGIKSDAMFGGGHGEEMFQSMMTDEYSKQVVKRGGLGLSQHIMDTLIAEQEKSR